VFAASTTASASTPASASAQPGAGRQVDGPMLDVGDGELRRPPRQRPYRVPAPHELLDHHAPEHAGCTCYCDLHRDSPSFVTNRLRDRRTTQPSSM
jgi:hypothetical protein